ncbi:MAG: carbon-nitrogen hydrolase family protein [Vulcanimicrobiaceae bacterium]
MPFKLALVQPIAHHPPNDEKNVADAVAAIARLAAQGANVIVFPETYPGPWRIPAHFNPTAALAAAAKQHGVIVEFGTLEPLDDAARTAHNTLVLALPDGSTRVYRRTHPPGPWLYTGGPDWEFQYVAADDDYAVVPTEYGIFAQAMCSEVYIPEVARAYALRGAEILLMPAGTDKRKLWSTWRTLLWARAIENIALVVTTQNMWHAGERGMALVATPEEILFESEKPGEFFVDIDLERIRAMRADVDGVNGESGTVYASKAGLLSQWQRPEMYRKFIPSEPAGRRR